MTTTTESQLQADTQIGERRVPVQYEERGPQYVNVGSDERKWSTYGGTALVLLGLARRGVGGLTLAAIGGSLLYRGVTGHCPLYGAIGRSTVDQERDAAKPEEYFRRGIHVEHAININKSPEELYRFWRNFEHLPQFMQHLKSVKVIDEKRSHWVARGPGGMDVEWDAEIINDEPNATIAWRSLGGAEVDNAGSVRFVPAPGDRGTEVHVVIDYIPPAGRVGSMIAKLFGEEPEIQVKDDLRNFKRMMELGEIPTIAGQPRGTCTR